MDNMQDDEAQRRQAKIEALRHLRDQNFYEPQTDNPEGLNLDEGQPQVMPQAANPQVQPIAPQPSPEQTMQQNPQNLINALKRKRESELMKSLFPEGERQ